MAGSVWSGSRSISADANETALNDPNTSAQGSITGGYYHACALLSTGAATCWGRNNYGQLGDGTTTNSYTPVQVAGLTSGVTAISAGAGHTCALLSIGAVQCWGWGSNGQLGNGNTTSSNTPVQVAGLTSGVTAISAGDYHTCALLSTGAAKCWGRNNYGQLGDGTTTTIATTTPVDVPGLTSGVTTISAGDGYTCAIQNGAAKCWGQNQYGEIGDGTATDRASPTQVAGLASGVTAISAGGDHTCALLSTGAAKCWGYNGNSQIGDGTTTNRTTPTQVQGLTSGVTAIASSQTNTCAIQNAAAKCWGANAADGRVGDGTMTNRTVPVQVLSLSGDVAAISAGQNFMCAIQNGAVKCWGRNEQGQIGDGTVTSTNTNGPTQVLGLTSGVGQTTTTTTVAPTTTTTTSTTSTTSSTTSSTTTVAPSTTSVAPSTSSPTVSSTTEPANISSAPSTQTSTITTTTPPSTSIPPATSTPTAPTTTTATSTTTTTEPEAAPDIEEFLSASTEGISTLIDQIDTTRGAALIINGTPTPVEVATTTTSTTLTFGLASLEVTCFDPDGQPIALSSQGRFTVRHGDTVAITATGFAPGSRINVAVFSDPVALGTTTIDDSGRTTRRWAIPDSIDAGDHTLVVSGDLARVKNTVFGLRIVVDQVSFITRIASNAWTRIIVTLGIAGGLLVPANRRRRRKS